MMMGIVAPAGRNDNGVACGEAQQSFPGIIEVEDC